MRITVIAVGKLSPMWKDAAQEYTKRISKYCKVTVIELSEEKTEGRLRENELKALLEKEAEKIQKAIPPGAYTCALDLKGELMDSEQFAAWMKRIEEENGEICFLIGSHAGLSEKTLEKCNKRLSFSPMTFPHQLARVMLLEQVYRGFAIQHGVPYHK